MKKLDVAQKIQILANVGVIAGIIFVGVELRQNTTAVNSEASHGMQGLITAVYEMLLHDPMMDIYQRGMADPANLTSIEAAKFHAFWTVNLQAYQNLYFQVREGAYDATSADGWWQVLRNLLEYPGAQEHWFARGFILSAEFREFVENDVMSREPNTGVLVRPKQ
jgi:hypothetical protein